MKELSKYFYLLIVSFFIGGCTLINEDDLSKESVYVIMPGDGLESISQSQTFWWEIVSGADNYNLQIVSPDFNSPEKLILDTTIVENRLSISLPPGTYYWRVCAENAYSITDYTTFSLTIIDTPDLSHQQVVLISPLDNQSIGDTSVHFNWYVLEGTTNYTMEIRKESWSGALVTLPMTIYSSDTTLYLNEGSYYWGIKATNNFSSTNFTVGSFKVDTTPPNTPLPLSPVEDSIISDSKVEFSWEPTIETNDQGIMTVLTISADSLFSQNSIIHNSKYQGAGCSVDISTPGIYYWRIHSEDSAGNLSSYCEFRQFTIQTD